MGVCRFYENIETNKFYFKTPYELFVHSLYSLVDIAFTYVEALYVFDFNIVYFWLLNSLFDDSIDFFFISVWYITLHTSSAQLLWSIILDNYICQNIMQFNLTDEWVRSYIASKDSALFVIYHPEIIFFKNQIINNFLLDFLADATVSTANYLDSESLITPVMLFAELLLILYICAIFVSLYFSFYSTTTEEGVNIDLDYLSSSVSIESEKEVGSLDDMLMPLIIFFYTFGWYFYLYC
jgi:hypothetical protein